MPFLPVRSAAWRVRSAALRVRSAALHASIASLGVRSAVFISGALLVALLLPGAASAASPAPYTSNNGNARTGTTPSYIGHPIMAAAFVVGLGIVVAGATIMIVRLVRTE